LVATDKDPNAHHYQGGPQTAVPHSMKHPTSGSETTTGMATNGGHHYSGGDNRSQQSVLHNDMTCVGMSRRRSCRRGHPGGRTVGSIDSWQKLKSCSKQVSGYCAKSIRYNASAMLTG
jgi:hypothetical protein